MHYLFDILRKHWSGTGDAKAYELVKNDKYLKKIKKHQWNNILDEWFENSLERKEKTRVNIKIDDILFLNYLYNQIYNAHDQLNYQKLEIDHICPVESLKKIIQNIRNEGLPIGNIANLCLIKKELNSHKSNKTYYEYFDNMLKKENNIYDIDYKIKEVEKFTFIKRDDLEFFHNKDLFSKEKYLNFLEKRFIKMKEKFFEFYNIEE